MSARVRRPSLLALLAALTGAVGAAAILGLAHMARALEGAPVVIVRGVDDLAPALEAAPWAGAAGEAPDSPVVWALAPLACERCAAFYDDVLPRIAASGAAVRIIVFAPRAERDAAALARAAHWGQARDASLLDSLRSDAPPRPLDDSAAAVEGYVEWGRASHDRLARILMLNGAEMEAPALFWRVGPEWRATFGDRPYKADYVRRDL